MAETWLVCSACRKEIAYGARYWQCSVSTCNRNRMRLVFCSVACWDSHLGEARHREAWAVEERAPSRETWQKELASEAAKPAPAPVPAKPAPQGVSQPVVRRVVGDASPATAAAPARSGPGRLAGTAVEDPSITGVKLSEVTDRDVLIVVSKMKKYIRDRSGFNCSDSVADMLSEHVRALCDEAIRAAARDDRKTVLDRDVVRPRR